MLFEKTTYDDDFPMSIRIANVSEYPLHYHKDVEFVYVLKGEVHLKCLCSDYTLKEGNIFINNSREVHSLNATGRDNAVAIIQISTRFFTQYFPTLHKACYMTYINDNTYPKLDGLRKMLLNILLDYSRRNFNYKSNCIYQMIEVIRYLNQNFNLFAFDGQNVINFKSDHPVIAGRISRIINYVYENHADKITLEDIAKSENLSTYYLSHLIRDYMGISFQEFLCFARVEMSEILLLQTDRRISTIAKDVGFSTTAYFEKYFLKWYKRTPEEHRKAFLPHVLSTENPAILKPLSEYQTISILKRCLSGVTAYESSPSTIDRLYLNVDIDPTINPVMDLNHSLEVAITLDDYNMMGERLFNALYDLNASKVALYVHNDDSETTTKLVANRLTFLGYQVSIHHENLLKINCCSGQDTIASAIQTLQSYFASKKTNLNCRLRDQGDPLIILKGCQGVMTSGLVPKPSFYAYRLLQNIKGSLLYWGKYYYIIKNGNNDSEEYIIVVMNYNDEILHLSNRKAGSHEVNDIINEYMDELNIDFSIPMAPGQYVVAKYALSNSNSIFAHMSHLGFPNKISLSEKWIHMLNTEPQSQVDIEINKDKLNISSSISGAGINVIVIKKATAE